MHTYTSSIETVTGGNVTYYYYIIRKRYNQGREEREMGNNYLKLSTCSKKLKEREAYYNKLNFIKQ